MESLSNLCVKAISDGSIVELERLIEICDKLHRGVPTDGYSIDDIPTDDLYMGMEHKLKELRAKGVTGILKPIEHFESKAGSLGEMWMGTDAIIKAPSTDARMLGKKVIVTPKYDGCSCAVKFVRSGDKFIVELARSRGRDVGTTQNFTVLTNEMTELLNDSNWFDSIHTCEMLKDVKEITVRGEIVVVDKAAFMDFCTKNKRSAVPASYVAGKINSNDKNLNEDGFVGFRMFEVMKVVMSDGSIEIPDQETTLQYLCDMDVELIYSEIVLDKKQDVANKQLTEILDNWRTELNEPIDGVVYCEPSWSYPTQKEELGVNYGKYALKPNVHSASRLKGIRYAIQKDGKLNPSIEFGEILLEGKKIASAHSSITDLYNFINEKHVHMNAIVEVMLSASISPMIKEMHDDENSLDKPLLTLPTNCPFCKNELKQVIKTVSGKKIVTLTCTNTLCNAIVNRRLECFFKHIGIKGISSATIEKSYKVQPGVVDNLENRLLNLFAEIGRRFNIKNAVMSSSVTNFLIAIDLMTKSEIEKDSKLKIISKNIVSTSVHTLMTEISFHNPDDYIKTLLKLIF